METEYYTLRDAARILVVKPYQIVYAISVGLLPEPRRLGGRRIFTIEELAHVSEVLKLETGKAFYERLRRDHRE